jgi:hypothetical protein
MPRAFQALRFVRGVMALAFTADFARAAMFVLLY